MLTGSAGRVPDDKQPDDVTDGVADDRFQVGGDCVEHAGDDQQFVELRPLFVAVDQVSTHVPPAVLCPLPTR